MGVRPLATVGILLAVLAQPRVAPAQARCDPPDNETRVRRNTECLVIRTFRPASPGPATTLLVFIHGDLSGGGPADYVYERAQAAAGEGRVALTTLREHHKADRLILVGHSGGPVLARDYVAALAKRGLPARFTVVPGAGHNDVVRRPELRSAIDELVTQLSR